MKKKIKVQSLPNNKTSLKAIPAQKILKFIEKWATAAEQQECRKLWGVLTALRGPDSDDLGLKELTTVFVRQHSVPTLAEKCGAYNGEGCGEFDAEKLIKYTEFMDNEVKPDYHFLSHFLIALRDLGVIDNDHKTEIRDRIRYKR